MNMRIPSKFNNRADISDCRNYLFLNAARSYLFSVIYHRSCRTNTCHKYLFLWPFQKSLSSVFIAFG